MPIDLSKRSGDPQLGRIAIEALGAGGRGAPSLCAFALDSRGTRTPDGFVCQLRPTAFDGALRYVGYHRPFGAASAGDTVEADLARLPPGAASVVLSLAHDQDAQRSQEVQVRIFDADRGDEILRRRVLVEPGIVAEFGRAVRTGPGWRLVEDAHTFPGSLEDLACEAPSGVHMRAPMRPKEPATPEDHLTAVATETSSGYCDASMRRSFIQRACAAGSPSDEAETIIDIELERLRVANETALLQRLDSVLRRFTDDDSRLDGKERRDALQIVCKPAPGHSQGLRHDVADRYVTQFCRERGIKVKTGLLRWAVP